MKLVKSHIKNFRSIRDITIYHDPSLRTLVGINESGKSNTLKALRLLSKDFNPTTLDRREELPDEVRITEAYVLFVFKLEKDDLDKIYGEIVSNLLSKSQKETPVLSSKVDGKKISIREFLKENDSILYKIDLVKLKKSPATWNSKTEFTVENNWKKVSESCPDDYIPSSYTDEPLNNYQYIDTETIKDIPEEYLTQADSLELLDLINDAKKDFLNENLPPVIYWEYNDKYLLPPAIKIQEFIDNPETCVPLRNMFTLAGYPEIKTEIESAKGGTHNSLRNLLARVATRTTKYFKEIWTEYDGVEFNLEPESDNIEAKVIEHNRFDLSQRSDGFKRFVSFMLIVSTHAKTELLKNALLLVDEPDMSLHPSGTRYLRDELIRISKTNLVVCSTHSIFMVDDKNMSRHIIVTKKDEVTDIKDANESNIVDEEVLFNAMGYSVFQTLNKINIIFEGWDDKQLFRTALKHIPTTHSSIKNLKAIGTSHVQGVKQIKFVAPLLELSKRELIIISDADGVAKERQKEHVENHGYGDWKRYDELNNLLNVITAEDFIKKDALSNGAKELSLKHPSLGNFDQSKLSDSRGSLFVIREWMKGDPSLVDQLKSLEHEFKEIVFGNLSYSDITPEYYEYLEKISILVSQLT